MQARTDALATRLEGRWEQADAAAKSPELAPSLEVIAETRAELEKLSRADPSVAEAANSKIAELDRQLKRARKRLRKEHGGLREGLFTRDDALAEDLAWLSTARSQLEDRWLTVTVPDHSLRTNFRIAGFFLAVLLGQLSQWSAMAGIAAFPVLWILGQLMEAEVTLSRFGATVRRTGRKAKPADPLEVAQLTGVAIRHLNKREQESKTSAIHTLRFMSQQRQKGQAYGPRVNEGLSFEGVSAQRKGVLRCWLEPGLFFAIQDGAADRLAPDGVDGATFLTTWPYLPPEQRAELLQRMRAMPEAIVLDAANGMRWHERELRAEGITVRATDLTPRELDRAAAMLNGPRAAP
jgi:hypothetical protein